MRLFLAITLSILVLALRIPNPPHELWIHGEKWTVIRFHTTALMELAGMGGVVGHTDCANRTIMVSLEETPADQADTLIHEVMHALTCESGDVHNQKWNNEEVEHPGIEWGSGELVRFMRENSEAVRWLQSQQ